MPIALTRALVRAAVTGALADVPTRTGPIFGLAIPTACPDVPDAVLDPRSTWANPDAYDAQAHRLAGMFAANFRAFADAAPAEVRAAGPR